MPNVLIPDQKSSSSSPRAHHHHHQSGKSQLQKQHQEFVQQSASKAFAPLPTVSNNNDASDSGHYLPHQLQHQHQQHKEPAQVPQAHFHDFAAAQYGPASSQIQHYGFQQPQQHQHQMPMMAPHPSVTAARHHLAHLLAQGPPPMYSRDPALAASIAAASSASLLSFVPFPPLPAAGLPEPRPRFHWNPYATAPSSLRVPVRPAAMFEPSRETVAQWHEFCVFERQQQIDAFFAAVTQAEQDVADAVAFFHRDALEAAQSEDALRMQHMSAHLVYNNNNGNNEDDGEFNAPYFFAEQHQQAMMATPSSFFSNDGGYNGMFEQAQQAQHYASEMPEAENEDDNNDEGDALQHHSPIEVESSYATATSSNIAKEDGDDEAVHHRSCASAAVAHSTPNHRVLHAHEYVWSSTPHGSDAGSSAYGNLRAVNKATPSSADNSASSNGGAAAANNLSVASAANHSFPQALQPPMHAYQHHHQHDDEFLQSGGRCNPNYTPGVPRRMVAPGPLNTPTMAASPVPSAVPQTPQQIRLANAVAAKLVAAAAQQQQQHQAFLESETTQQQQQQCAPASSISPASSSRGRSPVAFVMPPPQQVVFGVAPQQHAPKRKHSGLAEAFAAAASPAPAAAAESGNKSTLQRFNEFCNEKKLQRQQQKLLLRAAAAAAAVAKDSCVNTTVPAAVPEVDSPSAAPAAVVTAVGAKPVQKKQADKAPSNNDGTWHHSMNDAPLADCFAPRRSIAAPFRGVSPMNASSTSSNAVLSDARLPAQRDALVESRAKHFRTPVPANQSVVALSRQRVCYVRFRAHTDCFWFVEEQGVEVGAWVLVDGDRGVDCGVVSKICGPIARGQSRELDAMTGWAWESSKKDALPVISRTTITNADGTTSVVTAEDDRDETESLHSTATAATTTNGGAATEFIPRPRRSQAVRRLATAGEIAWTQNQANTEATRVLNELRRLGAEIAAKKQDPDQERFFAAHGDYDWVRMGPVHGEHRTELDKMDFADIEFQMDMEKITVYFRVVDSAAGADGRGRVQFVSLASWLNKMYKCRVWLHDLRRESPDSGIEERPERSVYHNPHKLGNIYRNGNNNNNGDQNRAPRRPPHHSHHQQEHDNGSREQPYRRGNDGNGNGNGGGYYRNGGAEQQQQQQRPFNRPAPRSFHNHGSAPVVAVGESNAANRPSWAPRPFNNGPRNQRS